MISFTSVHSCLGGSQPGGDTEPPARVLGPFSPESQAAQTNGHPELTPESRVLGLHFSQAWDVSQDFKAPFG